MRVLLDTNILIHREAAIVVRHNIGSLFLWLDRLGYEKWIHPTSVEEIGLHQDERVRTSFKAKIASYRMLDPESPLHPEVAKLSALLDQTDNDLRDTKILNELVSDRVDFIITEDRGILRKAERLGIADQVFTIDGFLEKVVSENPELIDYDVLAVRRSRFGQLDLQDQFFDSFRGDYPGFDRWFNRKSEEPCYVCHSNGAVVAFLYLKVEDANEPYPDIDPPFPPKRRLKIGSFKVELNGFRLGERFLKIVFDNAIKQRVDEIYATIFPKTIEQQRLISLLEEFGFTHHGLKRNNFGDELVFLRDMTPRFLPDNPKATFPYISRRSRAFLVPIYPEYHTELLPDSILQTESPDEFIEQEPHRNAIRKVYVSRSYFRDLIAGDTIIFYRTGGKYKSVVTTLGIVEIVHLNIQDEDSFVRLCRWRSVFTDDQLRAHWRHSPSNRPFVVHFLYAYSFPKRPNLARLIEHGVIADVKSAPRGFTRITDDQFDTILRLAEVDPRIIVD